MTSTGNADNIYVEISDERPDSSCFGGDRLERVVSGQCVLR